MESQFIPFFALLHIVGALVGTVSVTYAEIFYIKAASDGNIDKHERKYLRRLYRGITIGTLILIFAGSALMTLEYLVPYAPQSVLTAPFWTIQILTLLILLMGYIISKKEATWAIGSGIIFTAWWMVLFIDLGFTNSLGYAELFIIYIIAAAIVSGILWYARKLFSPRTPVA
jgi:uncharacterized membrane protein YhdT